MRVAIYARTSTSDGRQDAQTQLLPLREFAGRQGWPVVAEYVDRASAVDLRGRTGWRRLMEDAARRRFDVVLVARLDRAFRSVVHLLATLEEFRRLGVSLRSLGEPWVDTARSSAAGDLVLTVLAAVAEFERGLIRERVRLGLDRARRQGKRLGRPAKVGAREVAAMRAAGRSVTEVARALGVHRRTVQRCLRRAAPAT